MDTRLQGQSMLDECVEEYRRGSAKRKPLRGEPGMTVRGGEFAFAYWHPAWVCEAS